MLIVTLAYPRDAGSTFDFTYYRDTHMPLVAELWQGTGYRGSEALRGIGGMGEGEESPFHAIAILRFDSLDCFQAAIGSEAGARIVADVARFTSVQPLVQLNETLWNTQEMTG